MKRAQGALGGIMWQTLSAMTGGIRFRVFMLISLVAVVLMAFELASSTAMEVRARQHQALENAKAMTGLLARSLEKQFEYFELSEIEAILAGVKSRKNVERVMATDAQRSFYLDGDNLTPSLLSMESWPVQERSLKSGQPSYEQSNATLTIAEPLLRDGNVIGSVAIVYSMPTHKEILIPALQRNLGTTLPLLLAGLVMAGVLVRQISAPMGRLVGATKEVVEGDLETHVPIGGPREVRELGQAINTMLANLRKNIEQIYELAYVDRTTQLPNREFFRKELTRAIQRTVRQKSTGALLFVDLDGFKRVNDTHGHDTGDELLLQFSERLSSTLRVDDLIGFKAHGDEQLDAKAAQPDKDKNKQMLARLGGDEFTILLSELRDATDAATVSQRIIDAVSHPFEVGGTQVTIGASVGIAIFPRDGSDYQTVLKSADMAMYQAKEEGKNTYRYFSEELNREAGRRMAIEQDLRAALENGQELRLHYQPKIDCTTGLPSSVEALIRWQHPSRGMVAPMEFIPIAEDCGLILPLGRWILTQACEQIVRFEQAGIDVNVAVNISTAQFSRPELSNTIVEILQTTGADPTKLELELTESMAMQDPDMALAHIEKLKSLGIRFAIDDFGTGYSNLSQLSRLPFDVFKIDRSFVEMLSNPDDEHGRVIVKTILAMAKSLDYETVAEGVETVGQVEFLSEYGCNFVQGYYFTKPLAENDFLSWYRQWYGQDSLEIAQRMRQGVAA